MCLFNAVFKSLNSGHGNRSIQYERSCIPDGRLMEFLSIWAFVANEAANSSRLPVFGVQLSVGMAVLALLI